MTTLSLKPVVDVSINLSPKAAVRNAFDLLMIAGDSTVVPVAERIRIYYGADEMLDDGFVGTEPEYIAAQLAFSATAAPDKIAIGRVDATNGAIHTLSVNNGGSGYQVDDVLTVVQQGGTGATFKVTAVDAGKVTAVEALTYGTGYTAANAVATTCVPATDRSGCTVDIERVGERAVTALRAIREANHIWYTCMICDITEDEILEVAAYVEAAIPSTIFGFNSSAPAIITNSDLDIFSLLKARNYRRTFGQYITDAEQPNGVAGILGYMMGANTGLANSAYTAALKRVPGLIVEDITSTQAGYIEGKNGNVYVNRGYYYDIFEPGTYFDGTWLDEMVNLDKLANDIQLGVMDLLYQLPKVPQTEGGMTQIKGTINAVCEVAVKIGFVAPGRWNGPNILELSTGDTLPRGYLVQSEPIDEQIQADRDARKAPPIYVAIKLAGAIQSVVIRVDVNR